MLREFLIGIEAIQLESISSGRSRRLLFPARGSEGATKRGTPETGGYLIVKGDLNYSTSSLSRVGVAFVYSFAVG